MDLCIRSLLNAPAEYHTLKVFCETLAEIVGIIVDVRIGPVPGGSLGLSGSLANMCVVVDNHSAHWTVMFAGPSEYLGIDDGEA